MFLGKVFLERVFIFLFFFFFFIANSEIEVSVSARNVRRLLSFQRYLRSSRFFRGITVPNSSNILDDDYNGQAKVGGLIFILVLSSVSLKCVFAYSNTMLRGSARKYSF